jgi:hypothetical protein
LLLFFKKEEKTASLLFKMTERFFAKAIDKFDTILYNNKDKNNCRRRLWK